MKNLLLVLVLLPVMAKAQVVNSVCGVKFGSSYSTVVMSLKNVYGMTDESFYQKERIIYCGKTFENVLFDALVFYFVGTDTNRQFNKAKFNASYATWDEVFDMREKLVSSLGKSVEIKRIKDDEGYVTYWGGLSPTDRSKYAFQIYISEGDGKYPYTLNLEFGPYDYK